MNKNGQLASIISFEEIVKGRDASARVTDDGLLYAIDLVMVVTGHSRDYAGWVLRNIPDGTFTSEKFTQRQLSTRGGPKTKLISFEDAIELVMVLPGNCAKKIRIQIANIIKRYIQGDKAMHSELDKNKTQGIQKTCMSILNKAISSQKTDEIPTTKYIYATYSEAFPGLVKIGRAKDVKARISSGNTMCAPKPHKVIAMAPTLDAVRDETMAHAYFAPHRVEGEFFTISHLSVAVFLENHINKMYQQELKELIQKLNGGLF